jgi:uncharacterized protein (TIGR02246 family)
MSSDEQEIRQLVDRWFEATKAGDVDTVLSLMSDDVVFLVPGRAPMDKAAFAEGMKAQSADGAPQFDGTSEIREVKVLGDWAYMWTHLTVVFTPAGGEPARRSGHTLSVLKKVGGRWVLARDANMLAPEQPGAERAPAA